MLPASALSLIQMDAQVNPNMTSEETEIGETSALALAMKRVQVSGTNSDAGLNKTNIKTLTVHTDQDTPSELYADVEALKLDNWAVKEITAGPIEVSENTENSNITINSILNAYSFTKKIRHDSQNISMKYDESLPVKSISVKMKLTSDVMHGGAPNA
jgi:hypothetical protein